MVPFFATDTQLSIEPFPEPILTSKGFLVRERWGKILIRIFPPLRRKRTITFRTASIWLFLIHAPDWIRRPYSPQLSSLFPLAFPS